MNTALPIALCNEVLQPLPFAQQCALAAQLGYDGLEVAPFTLAPDPLAITDTQARQYRKLAQDHGLQIHGLHWLLVAPAGLSIVSSDDAVRERTACAMERLVELCSLMGGRYLVHGSPRQRAVPEGATREQAWERAARCFRPGQAWQRTSSNQGIAACISSQSPIASNSVAR